MGFERSLSERIKERRNSNYRKDKNMNNLNYRTIRRTFSAWTVVYDWLTPIYLLGNEGRLRRTTVQALYLRKGQVVLDVACGTGRNFPYILEKIGSRGASSLA